MDLTLGDYWGVWIHDPEMDDDMGTSLLFILELSSQVQRCLEKDFKG